MRFHHEIGFANSGGFVIAEHLQSHLHRDEYIAFVLALSTDFVIVDEAGTSQSCTSALIPRETRYRLRSNDEGLAAFIHLDPFTDAGMLQVAGGTGITPMDRSRFEHVAEAISDWVDAGERSVERAETVLQLLVAELTPGELEIEPIDPRIMKCIDFVKRAEITEVNLSNAARSCSLSPGRLSHLFRQETGGTFRSYVLHQKLVRSLRAVHEGSGLTTASFTSGFADQPHFTHAFKKAFGIKPSSMKG
jgi:AraC-like DNA-binding protein